MAKYPVKTKVAMMLAAAGAAIVLVITAVLNWDGLGGQRGNGGKPGTDQVFDAETGACLHFRYPDAADIRQVDCRQPHLFELTGRADLSKQFPPGVPFPAPEQWQAVKEGHCMEHARAFLHGKFDPHGRFSVGAFTPTPDRWTEGDRTLHCGLQQAAPSGRLLFWNGAAPALNQSDAYPVGRCLGISGTAVWDPTECQNPHAVEITGIVDLGEQFTAQAASGQAPSEDEQDSHLATKCAELTAQYTASPTKAQDSGLVVYWDTLVAPSWEAGSRLVNCKVSAQLPDGSGLAPIVGSVKETARVEPHAAPLQPGQPGVPAGMSR